MQRRFSTMLIGSLVLALVLGACGFAPAPSPAPGGGTTARPVTAWADRAAFDPGSAIFWMNDGDRRRELDAMAATGAKWIALDFDWNSIQGDGQTRFRGDRSTDTVVPEARPRDLKIIGPLAYSPPWARRAVCRPTSHCLPADP